MAKKKIELDAFADLNMLKDPAEPEKNEKPVIEEKKQQKVVKKTETKKIPKRRETKQRIGFAIYPSLYEKLNKIAYIKNISTSKLMDDILQAYASSKEAQAMLAEYDSMDV